MTVPECFGSYGMFPSMCLRCKYADLCKEATIEDELEDEEDILAEDIESYILGGKEYSWTGGV